MCPGIPMNVVAVDGHLARCEAKGVERVFSLFMMQDEPVPERCTNCQSARPS